MYEKPARCALLGVALATASPAPAAPADPRPELMPGYRLGMTLDEIPAAQTDAWRPCEFTLGEEASEACYLLNDASTGLVIANEFHAGGLHRQTLYFFEQDLQTATYMAYALLGEPSRSRVNEAGALLRWSERGVVLLATEGAIALRFEAPREAEATPTAPYPPTPPHPLPESKTASPHR